MNWFFTRRYLAVWMTIMISLATVSRSWSQSISVTAVSPATNLCSGSTISLTFSTTGVFTAGNIFTLQMSDANGIFQASPVEVAFRASAPVIASTQTVSGNLGTVAYGTGYRFRVVSSSPQRTSNPTTTDVTIGTDVPAVSNRSFCLNSGTQPISTTSTGIIEWYNGSAAAAPVVFPGSTYNVPTTSTPVTYYVTRTVNNCKSAKAAINVTLTSPPAAPNVSNVSVCQNAPQQTLTASGNNLTWYVQGNNTPLTGAPRPSTSQPNSQTIYEVTQTDGNGCVSPKSAGLTFFVRTPPASPTAGTFVYCEAQAPASLTASGNNLTWYVQGNNTPLPGAPRPSTAGNYTYLVTQTDGNGCQSSPLSVPVQVKDTPDAPATPYLNNIASFCQNQASRSLEATGNNLLWYTAANGVGVTQAPSPATTNQGDTQYFVTQTNADGCQSSQRAIIARVLTPPTAPNVSNVSVCQNAPQQTLTASGNNLTWYVQGNNTPLPGAPRPSTSQPNSQTIYEVTQTNGNGCVSPKSVGLTFFVRTPPAIPTTGSFIYCEAQAPASLTANGNNLRWYTNGGSNLGTFLASNTLTAPSTAGNYTYQVTQTDGNGCQSSPLSVPVQVKDTPDAPTTPYLNNIASFCQNQASRSLEATGNNLLWYTAANGVGVTQAPSPATTNQGDTPYFVTQTNADGCQSSQRTITARVNITPGAPTSAQSRTYCSGETATPLTATEPGVRWYTDATGGTGSTQAPTPGTAATNVAQPQLFFLSQTVGNCESIQRQQVSVTVKRSPDAPATQTSVEFCRTYSAPALTATGETGASIIWLVDGRESATAPTPPNDAVRVYTYQVVQQLNGCRSTPATVRAQVKPTPDAPSLTPYSLCVGRESRPLQATGTDLKYYTANDQLLGQTAPSPSTTQSTTVVYKVSQSLAGCEGPKATYNVPVYPIPANPGFTPPKEYCAEEAAVPLVASGQTLLWYTGATGGPGNNQAPTPSTAATNVGSGQTFYVTQTVLGCESLRQPIAITVKRKPGLPTTSNPEFCQTYTAPTLTATPETGASIIWLVDGSESATAPTPQNTVATTYTYQVVQELNGCRSNAATVSVRVKPTPGLPGITPFQLCQLSPGRALQASGTDLKYYDVNNSLLGSTAPVVSTETARTVTYRVSQSTNGCEGPKADYAVVVQPKPAPPVTQALNYCLESTNIPDQPKQSIQPLTAQGQNLQWYFVDGNPFPAGFAPTPAVNSTNVFDFRVTQTVNSCVSDQALLRVSIQTTPAPVVSTSLVTYCRNEVARPLEATGTNLRWIDPNGVVTSQTPTPPTTNATKGGEAYQVYSIGTNGCVSPRNTVRLVVNTNPTLGLLGSTTVNYGQSTTLRLLFTSSPPYTYTLTDGTSGVANDTISSVMVKPLETTTYRVASVSNVCGNGLPGNPATATVFVNVPTITTQALTAGTLCAGTSFAVAYTTTGVFNAGNAFKIQVADTTSKSYVDVSQPGLGSTLTGNLPATLKGGVYFVRVVATNPGAEVPGLRSPSVLTVRGLPSALLTGTQDIYEGSPASLSIALGGDGPWTISYSFTTEGESTSATSTFQTNASPHLLSVQPPKTANYFLTAVSNNCGTGPVSGTASITVLPLLAVENPLLNTISLYPVPTQNLLTVAIDLPLTPQQPAQLLLRDLTGTPVLTRQTDTRQTVLDLSQQPAGLYLLTVQVGEHRIVRKIMKQ
ncbi:T9SS type A sorting domain-containing protein [Fibrella aquatica]|uniref:Ig-like domain-containing protein n=1 Tax=Fibrella aquatica TaxID=3242487 RepID=UPI0035211DD2